MAMRSEAIRTPDWLRVEITHDPRSFEYRLDIGVKCHDGWAHIVSLMADPSAFGSEVFNKKLEVFQKHHEFVTRKLAVETLEKT
jgi:hypothetical protein